MACDKDNIFMVILGHCFILFAKCIQHTLQRHVSIALPWTPNKGSNICVNGVGKELFSE